MPIRTGLAMLMVLAMTGAAWAHDHHATPTPDPKQLDRYMPGAGQLGLSLLQIAEMKLTQGDYFGTLKGAYWASGVGEPIVPVLAQMLENERKYGKDERAFIAFPFNAIWALGRIASPASIAALQKYQAGKHGHDASLAIKAALLRRKHKDKEVGVSLREDAKLFASASHDAKVLKTLAKGTPVKALAFRLPNLKQKNARGEVATFDHVRLLPSGPEGYLERAGDDFATIY
jgi:hypothetical protein